jgi:hypothetical protein
MVPASRLLNFQNQAFQVFGLRQIQHNGMIGCGAAALTKPHPSTRVGRRCRHCAFEISPTHMMRTGTSYQQAALPNHLESPQV